MLMLGQLPQRAAITQPWHLWLAVSALNLTSCPAPGWEWKVSLPWGRAGGIPQGLLGGLQAQPK